MLNRWKIGDRIGGLYEIKEILGGEGKSGMGVVYICYYPWHQKLYALKTYQDRFIIYEKLTNLFYNEAILWMKLESHPHIVQAHWVHQLDSRIYIVMEYINSDNRGRRSLTDHLKKGPLPFIRTLVWSIQFCYGMEYANAKGLKVHRDIKPDNILITLDKTLKITDFGIARAFDEEIANKRITVGTPFWMSPEQFEDSEACDVRSDIYSFGLVLYQMVSGNLPFLPTIIEKDIFHQMFLLHKYSPIPKINSPIFPIIERCLAKKPEERYQNFSFLRKDLEDLWIKYTDIPLPKPLTNNAFGFKELNQKGVALKHLGKPEEAIKYHEKAIEENPVFPNAWNDKGVALWDLGKFDEALKCFDKAIMLDHEFVHPLSNKAGVLADLGKNEDAINYYDMGLEVDPNFINLWRGKGLVLYKIGRYEEAMNCFDMVLEINRRDFAAWYLKGVILYLMCKKDNLGKEKVQEALKCLEFSLVINPFLIDSKELINKIKEEYLIS